MERTASRSPAVTLGPRLAADIVTMVREGAGIGLDRSPSSLARVDRVVDGIRDEGPPPGAVDRALLGFGAYACEVLVRHAGATWLDFDLEQREVLGGPFGVFTPDGRVWDPVGEAFGRYADRTRHSLHRLYLSAAGRAGR